MITLLVVEEALDCIAVILSFYPLPTGGDPLTCRVKRLLEPTQCGRRSTREQLRLRQ